MKAAGLGQAFYTASMCADSIVSFVKLANSSESRCTVARKAVELLCGFPSFPSFVNFTELTKPGKPTATFS